MKTKADTIFTNLKLVLMSASFKERHRDKKESFARKRILGFVDLITLQLNRVVLSLAVELEKFLTIMHTGKGYSKQAFSKARGKLKHTAFVALHQEFVKDYYRLGGYKLYKGKYLLVAVDGSLCQLPESGQPASYFGRSGNQHGQGMVMGRASVMYDVLNQISLDNIFGPCRESEKAMFDKHQQNFASQLPFIKHPLLYLLDRSYPSFDRLQDLQQQGDCFVVRCKAGFCKEVKEFVGKDIDEQTIYIACKDRNKAPSAPAGIHLRIVRVLLPGAEYEYLLTNTDFNYKQLSALYFMRWKVETFYSFLKEHMQLENFSSKTVEGVLQDFHACLLTANISSLLIQEAQQELEQEGQDQDNKYHYQINKNVAVGILRDKIPELLLSPNKHEDILEELKMRIKRHKVPIVPNRSFTRHKLKRSRRKFHFSKKRAF
jgi:hypothetical protein